MHAPARLLVIAILFFAAGDALAAKRRCAALCRDDIRRCIATGAQRCAAAVEGAKKCVRIRRRDCRGALLEACRLDGDRGHCRAPSTTTTTVPGSAGATTTTTLPEGVSAVLRLRCLPDDRVEVLTPVVATQHDGVRVEALQPPPAGEVGIHPLAFPGNSWWSGSSGLDAEFVRPVPAGEARVWCIQGPFQTEPDAGSQGSFTLVDLAGWYVPYALDCAPAEQRSLEFQGFPAPPPSSIDEAVRVFVSGLLPTDTVEQAGYVHGDPAWPGLEARVVRESRIIARVHLRGGGVEYLGMAGAYCAGTGVGQVPCVPHPGPFGLPVCP